MEQEEATQQEVNTVFEQDESDDEKQYCICRGMDDGSFMISCERCSEWLVEFYCYCLELECAKNVN